jgi:hypothetical protein
MTIDFDEEPRQAADAAFDQRAVAPAVAHSPANGDVIGPKRRSGSSRVRAERASRHGQHPEPLD